MNDIALQVKAPQFETPVESQAKVMQLRQLLQADKMGLLQQKQQEQAMQDDASYRAAIQANPTGGEGLLSALAGAGNYKGHATAVKSALDARKTNADITKTESEVKDSDSKRASHQFEIAGQMAGAWAMNPAVTKAQIQSGLNAALNSGVISPEIAQAKLAEVTALGDDPASLNGWAKTTLMQITKAKDQHDLTTVDANTRANNARMAAEGQANRANQIQVQGMIGAREVARDKRRTDGLSISHGVKGLTEDQYSALSEAINSGRLNPDRINGRTASLLADLAIKNPTTDFTRLGADAALGKNAQFQQKALVAFTLPEIMESMVASGKKIGFSDVRTVGKMQGWVKGELNDPDMTEYMVQRNDALMSIAGVMRGYGMTDMAHKAETETASPTMSPAAMDAWLRGQMKSLEPRLKNNARIMHTDTHGRPNNSTTPTKPGGSGGVVEFGSLK